MYKITIGGFVLNYRNEQTDKLFEAILGLKDVDDCYKFFDDLCTVKEILDMAQRLEAACRLNKGQNYLDISKEIGISTATISRVSKCLNYGSGGYKAAIERLDSNENK